MRVSDTSQPTGVKAILVELFQSMSEEEQEFLRGVAAEVRELLKQGQTKEAAKKCACNLDTEEQLALWSLLDSKERAAIKKAGT